MFPICQSITFCINTISIIINFHLLFTKILLFDVHSSVYNAQPFFGFSVCIFVLFLTIHIVDIRAIFILPNFCYHKLTFKTDLITKRKTVSVQSYFSYHTGVIILRNKALLLLSKLSHSKHGAKFHSTKNFSMLKSIMG